MHTHILLILNFIQTAHVHVDLLQRLISGLPIALIAIVSATVWRAQFDQQSIAHALHSGIPAICE